MPELTQLPDVQKDLESVWRWCRAAGAMLTNLLAPDGKIKDDHIQGHHKARVDTAGSVPPEIGGIPTGTILAYGAPTAPLGYLICDGGSYLRTSYPALFAVISTRFGAADATHFNVPKLQGRFLRGWDHGVGLDPGAAGRTAMQTGGATGDNIGSVQADAFEAHTHVFDNGNSALLNAPGSRTLPAGGTTLDVGGTLTNTGGNETRPVNAGVQYIIRA